MARTLYKEDDRFIETYWDRFGRDTYLVGDAARVDEDGCFWIVGRIDDVINVSGHRLSTMEVESTLVSNPKVAEAAVVGVPDEMTGQAIVAFVIPEGGDGDGMEDELRAYVADKIGKLARPKQIVVCDDLPKTRSGKIMRRILRSIGQGEDDLGDVTTLRDPDVVEDVQKRFAKQERLAPGATSSFLLLAALGGRGALALLLLLALGLGLARRNRVDRRNRVGRGGRRAGGVTSV